MTTSVGDRMQFRSIFGGPKKASGESTATLRNAYVLPEMMVVGERMQIHLAEALAEDGRLAVRRDIEHCGN